MNDMEHLEELIQLEYQIDKAVSLNVASDEEIAMAYTCLAHDYFYLPNEIEGWRLLSKADDICPDYFSKIIDKQAIDNPEFAILISRLSVEIGRFRKGDIH